MLICIPNHKLPFIESKDGAKIYYETFGHEKPYPIILIHPIGGNIDIWDHEIPFILKRGFKIMAYEIRGHNRSIIGNNRNFSMFCATWVISVNFFSNMCSSLYPIVINVQICIVFSQILVNIISCAFIPTRDLPLILKVVLPWNWFVY